jgi:hypothetical protein
MDTPIDANLSQGAKKFEMMVLTEHRATLGYKSGHVRSINLAWQF